MTFRANCRRILSRYMGGWKVLRERDSARRYCGTAISLLSFCLRVCFLPETSVPTRFTDNQRTVLSEYKEYLASVTDSPATDVEKFQTALFSVLFREQGVDITPAGRLSCPVQSYIALLSLRKAGDFVKASLVTQPISRLLYLPGPQSFKQPCVTTTAQKESPSKTPRYAPASNSSNLTSSPPGLFKGYASGTSGWGRGRSREILSA